MIDQSHTATIDRPVGEVFDFVAEPSNEPKWHFDVREVVRPKKGPNARWAENLKLVIEGGQPK